jgi:hypothetical protein
MHGKLEVSVEVIVNLQRNDFNGKIMRSKIGNVKLIKWLV